MTTTALLDFTQPQGPAATRLRHVFGAPRQVLVAHALHEVRAVLDAVHASAQRGHWCVGYVAYEAAAAFDAALHTHAADGPLAWFAVYDAPLPWPDGAPAALAAATAATAATSSADFAAPAPGAAPAAEPAAQVDWTGAPERADFDAAIAHIQQAIGAGELYQVNYTAPLTGPLRQGSAAALFAALQRAQPGGYSACIDTAAAQQALAATDTDTGVGVGVSAATAPGGSAGTPAAPAMQVLSVSPELFFDWQDAPGGGHILARPMKGTAPRGATPEEDAAQAAHLRTSAKERAENVMIVDLLRNDLSRIAQPHSVQVPALFHTAPLPTVWQMTSDVQARTRPGTTLTEVFAALFPCGSVTGAPKVRAMQMIRALEPAPRGVYCGAIGVVRPAGVAGADGLCRVAATFNVPIRTVVLRATPDGSTTATCGIGSGITSGASAAAEWQEWRHKRAFAERASAPFDLLETLALDGGQLRHQGEHLARLHAAAVHFGYPWSAEAVAQCLHDLARAHPQGLWRVRLLLSAQGQPRAEAFALQPTPVPVRLQLAPRPFEAAHSEFVRYKTTRRAHYAAFAPTAPGVFDTVLWNEAGEITECTFGNIAALLDGRWTTPPLACGLLPGVGRAVALRQGRVTEAVLRVDDVPRVQAWAFINSLRGWLDAQWVD